MIDSECFPKDGSVLWFSEVCHQKFAVADQQVGSRTATPAGSGLVDWVFKSDWRVVPILQGCKPPDEEKWWILSRIENPDSPHIRFSLPLLPLFDDLCKQFGSLLSSDVSTWFQPVAGVKLYEKTVLMHIRIHRICMKHHQTPIGKRRREWSIPLLSYHRSPHETAWQELLYAVDFQSQLMQRKAFVMA